MSQGNLNWEADEYGRYCLWECPHCQTLWEVREEDWPIILCQDCHRANVPREDGTSGTVEKLSPFMRSALARFHRRAKKVRKSELEYAAALASSWDGEGLLGADEALTMLALAAYEFRGAWLVVFHYYADRDYTDRVIRTISRALISTIDLEPFVWAESEDEVEAAYRKRHFDPDATDAESWL